MTVAIVDGCHRCSYGHCYGWSLLWRSPQERCKPPVIKIEQTQPSH
ncbi:MAG: hypothetical protein AAGA67_02745 [Cyanobacteria bacterium P01_F01_bin.153]